MIIQPTTPDTSSKLQPKDSRMAMKHRTASGFTIVELLIVIVIIAILAAITIVAYSGIQQRAQNSAIISAAQQTEELVESYIAENGTYPLVGTVVQDGSWTTFYPADACITSSSGCVNEYGNTTNASSALSTALQTIGNPPMSVASPGKNGIGIDYSYSPANTVDGKAQPVFMTYFLLGSNQSCGLSGVLTLDASWAANGKTTTSTTGYTANYTLNGIPKTKCIVTIPGPSA